MAIEHKNFLARVDTEENTGVITALVSVFNNIDRTKEVVMPGAFTKSLQQRLPKGVWAHDWQQPIAKTLEAKETDEGLVIKGQFNLDTQRGREAYSDIKFGIIDEFSIGYHVVRESVSEKTQARNLDEVELFEWSPVLVGMNPDTQLLSIKSDVLATFATQADNALAHIESFVTRAKALATLRAKEGRVISAANRTRISAALEAIRGMQSLADELESMLESATPPEKADEAEVRKVYAQFLQQQRTYRSK